MPGALQRPCCRPRCRGAAGRHRCADVPARRCRFRADAGISDGPRGDDRVSAARGTGDLHAGDPRANAQTAGARRRRVPRAACRNAACRSCAFRNSGRRRGTDGRCARHDRPKKHRASATASNSPRSPGFAIPVAVAEILARAAVRRAARRKFLVAAEFPLGPVTAGTVAIARRARRIGAISPRAVALLAKTFTARGVRPLLSAALAGRVGFLVAEFPVLETGGRTGIAARGAVVLLAPDRRADRRAFRRGDCRRG